MRAWVIFSTDAGSAVTAQIASDLLEPTITARPPTDRLKHRPLEKSWRCRPDGSVFGAKMLKSLALPRGLGPCFRRERDAEASIDVHGCFGRR